MNPSLFQIQGATETRKDIVSLISKGERGLPHCRSEW